MNLKNGFGKCSLSVLSANEWKEKTWPLRFPAKENPNMEWALFDWPIVLQYDVKAKYRLISRNFFGHEVFSAERSLNHPKAKCVCIRSIFVRLLFLFCSRVFISKSYETRSSISVCKLPGISRTCTNSVAHWIELFKIRYSPFSHRAQCTLFIPPPNFCITFDYNFFFVWQSSQEKSKTMVMQNL